MTPIKIDLPKDFKIWDMRTCLTAIHDLNKQIQIRLIMMGFTYPDLADSLILNGGHDVRNGWK